MTEKQADQENTVSSIAGTAQKTVDREVGAATTVLGEATDAVKKTATSLGSGAKKSAANEVEGVKQEASESLRAFADAVHGAGEKLAESDQGMAAQMVQEAARGLERLSTALGKKELQDIVADVRDFGRNNPTALIAGSVLAGLALGRFVRSTDDDREPGPKDTRKGRAS